MGIKWQKPCLSEEISFLWQSVQACLLFAISRNAFKTRFISCFNSCQNFMKIGWMPQNEYFVTKILTAHFVIFESMPTLNLYIYIYIYKWVQSTYSRPCYVIQETYWVQMVVGHAAKHCPSEWLQNHNNLHKENVHNFITFIDRTLFLLLFSSYFFNVLILLLTAANCILIKFHHNFGCWYLTIEFKVSHRIFFFLFTFKQPKPHIKMAFLMLSLPAKATAEAETNTSMDWYRPALPPKTTNYSRNLDSHIQTHHQHLPQRRDKKIWNRQGSPAHWHMLQLHQTLNTVNFFCSFLFSPRTLLYVRIGCESVSSFWCHACCIVDNPWAFPPHPRLKNKNKCLQLFLWLVVTCACGRTAYSFANQD